MGVWVFGLGVAVIVTASAVAIDLVYRLVRYRTDIGEGQSPSSGRSSTAQGNYMRRTSYNQEGRIRLAGLYVATSLQLLGAGTMVVGLALGAERSIRETPLRDWVGAVGSVPLGLAGYVLAALIVLTVAYGAYGGALSRSSSGRGPAPTPPSWIVPSAILEIVLLGLVIWSIVT